MVGVVSYDQLEQDDMVAAVLEETADDPPVAYVWWPSDDTNGGGGAIESLRALAASGVPVIGTGWQSEPSEGAAEHLVAFVGNDSNADGKAVAELMVGARDYPERAGRAMAYTGTTAQQ